MIALITIAAILLSLSPAGYVIFRARMRDHYRHYHRDMKNVRKNLSCACCGGRNTALRRDSGSRQWVCKNRDLCRKAMVYTVMMESM